MEPADAERRRTLANAGSMPSTLVRFELTAGEGEACRSGSSSSSSSKPASRRNSAGMGGTEGAGDDSGSKSSLYSEAGLCAAMPKR